MENILIAPGNAFSPACFLDARQNGGEKIKFNFRRVLPPEWTDINEQGFCQKDVDFMRATFERRQKIGKAVPFFHLGLIKIGSKYLTTNFEQAIIAACGGLEDLNTLVKITVAGKLLRPDERKQIIEFMHNRPFDQELLQFEQKPWAFCPLKLSCPALEKLNRLTDSTKELLVKAALNEFDPGEICGLKIELYAAHNKTADQGPEMRRLRREIRRRVKIYTDVFACV